MKHLTKNQRYTISVMLENHYSKSDIAKVLKVDKSTITREIKRNCDKRDGTYRYELAERKRLGFLTPNEKFNLLTKLEKVAFAS